MTAAHHSKYANTDTMGVAPDRLSLLPPPIARRVAALLYECVLLFGVLMVAGMGYGLIMQQRHALSDRLGLQIFLFCTLALYFVWFWTHGGQTLAMRSWRIRVVDACGRQLTAVHALARYILAWLWVAPALLVAQFWAPLSPGTIYGLTSAWLAIYALAGLLRSDRQFLHDALCGTRLIDVRASTSTPC